MYALHWRALRVAPQQRTNPGTGKRVVRLATSRLTFFAGLLLILLAAPGLNLAQDTPAVSSRPVQVWLQRNIDDDGRDRLHFIDRRSGAETSIDLPGERYTVLREQVLYFDLADGRVRQVTAAGAISDHPFIQLPGATRRVDWLVAPDNSQIAWTLTEETATGQLRSFTRVAASDGSGMRNVLVDGPHAERHALPIAFSDDGATLYMDYQPLPLADAPRRQGYADLFALTLTEGFARRLPGEPGCLCGAAFGANLLLRLQLAEIPGGHELMLRDAAGELRGRIAAPALPGFTQARHLLLAPDGAQALYTLAQVRDAGGSQQAVRSVFVLADLAEGSSRILGAPAADLLRPLVWNREDDVVLVTSADPQRDGTWKLRLSDGALLPVAAASWLGALTA